ncbi:MAG: MBL fold metallo-hydrolase [Patescibacteria group bacterium]
MDIYWAGQAMFRLKGKTQTVILDPYEADFVGLKIPKDWQADIVLSSHGHQDHNNTQNIPSPSGTSPMVFKDPGEYEVGGVVITGISSYHDNSSGSQRGLNTILHLNFDLLNIVHLGDLGQSRLSEEQITQIGEVDILLIPVGSVYTIDGKDASEIVSQLEPKIIIPMHYFIEGLKFELDPVDKFLKEMGAEEVSPVPKLSISKEKLPEEPQVVVLSKS